MKNSPRIRRAAAAALLAGLAWSAHADGVPGQGTWQSVLQPRDLNGDGTADAYYDSSRNLSWAADADPVGTTDWASAQAWINSLNLYGVTGWRTPTIQAVAGGFPVCPHYSYDGSTDCGFNVDPSRSELAHMYQTVLGNQPWLDGNGAERPPGWGLSNTGPFRNLRPGDYPTSLTLYVPYGGENLQFVWLYQTQYGYQDAGVARDPTFHAWAVYDGDVMAAVPEPATSASLLGGLLAVVGWLKRRRH
jgi:hypothetical protein